MQRGILVGILKHLEHSDLKKFGDFLYRGHRRVADAAFWLVDNPQQAQDVGGIVQNAQIGDDILDFLAVEKTGAADDLIGDSGEGKS